MRAAPETVRSPARTGAFGAPEANGSGFDYAEAFSRNIGLVSEASAD